MVVFIDLDSDTVERDFPGNSFFYTAVASPLHIPHYARAPAASTSSSSPTSHNPSSRSKASNRKGPGKGKDKALYLENPNDSDKLHKLFRVVGIYPCIRSIVQHLDQTDLYNLSSTCRDMHQSLLENRRHLLPFTLRCQNSQLNQIQKKKFAPTSIRSLVVSTQCVADLVNTCERCAKPACRNCKTRSRKIIGQSQKRMTCTTCSSVSLVSLTEDPTIKQCVCQSKGEPWVCGRCADLGMENYLLKTDRNNRQTATVELECGRGTSCVGKGWYTCQNFYAYLDSAVKEEKMMMRKGEKVRYACSSCKQFVFNKEEEREFRALKT